MTSTLNQLAARYLHKALSICTVIRVQPQPSSRQGLWIQIVCAARLSLIALVVSASVAACGGNKSSSPSDPQAQDPDNVPQDVVPVGNSDAGSIGHWGSLSNWPLAAAHAVLLPDGRVVSYGSKGDGLQTASFIYDVWTPSMGLGVNSHTTLNNLTGTDLLGSAHVLLPDSGNLLIAGGNQLKRDGSQVAQNVANADVNLLDSHSSSLIQLPHNLNRVRLFPTMTTLADGRVLVQGGATAKEGSFQPQLTPEIYTPSRGFSLLTGANSDPAYGADRNKWWHPRAWLAPDGNVFSVSANQMFYVNPKGLGSITLAGAFDGPNAGASSTAVMYSPGLILQMGGGDFSDQASGRTGSSAASLIDIRSAGATVSAAEPMAFGRHWATATVLADGSVLVTGGAQGNNVLDGVAGSPERWDPGTGSWQTMAASESNAARLYQSTVLMLPDATVLVAGGESPGSTAQMNAELYFPPYLYTDAGAAAQRPVIESAPQTASWGNAVAVRVGASSPVSRVTLVRTGSVTRSFNTEQRFIELTFQQGTEGQLVVDLPATKSTAPPGFYMMFAFDDAGVPSVARIVKLWDASIMSAVDATSVPVAAGLVDGGFEVLPAPPAGGLTTHGLGQSIGAWQVTGGTVDLQDFAHQNAGDAGSQGSQHVDLNGNEAGEITQLVSGLIPGQRYALSFVYSRHPLASSSQARVRMANLDRTWTATNTGSSSVANAQGWFAMRVDFIPTQSSHALVFNGVGASAYGTLIDKVAISPVGTELVVDGGFEGAPNPVLGGYASLIPGDTVGPWLLTAGTVDVTENSHHNTGLGALSPSFFAGGQQHIDMNGSSYGTLTQTITGLTVGQRYVLSASYALHPFTALAEVQWTIAGVSKLLTAMNRGQVEWGAMSMVFTATATQHELAIEGTAGSPHFGVVIDDVSIISIPALVLNPDSGFESALAAPAGAWTTYTTGTSFGSWRVTNGSIDVHHNGYGKLGVGATGRHHVDLNGFVPGPSHRLSAA